MITWDSEFTTYQQPSKSIPMRCDEVLWVKYDKSYAIFIDSVFKTYIILCILWDKLESESAVQLLCYWRHLVPTSSKTNKSATYVSHKVIDSSEKKKLQKTEKCDLYIPLGKAFVRNGIACIKGGSNIEDSSRGDVSKVGKY